MGGVLARLAARKLESMEQKSYIQHMDFIFVKDAPFAKLASLLSN